MHSPTTIGREPFLSVVGQLPFLVLILVYAWIFRPNEGWSLAILAGGMTALVPQWQAARWSFKYWGARSAQKIVGAFYTGQALKFILTILFFVVCFKGGVQPPEVMLGTYCILVVVQRIIPLLVAIKTIRFCKGAS